MTDYPIQPDSWDDLEEDQLLRHKESNSALIVDKIIMDGFSDDTYRRVLLDRWRHQNPKKTRALCGRCDNHVGNIQLTTEHSRDRHDSDYTLEEFEIVGYDGRVGGGELHGL